MGIRYRWTRKTLAYMSELLGPVLKTGRLQPLRQHPSRCADLSPGWLHSTCPITLPEES
ncbi:hypothetical protein K505DRAFT_399929 [Melanomma pulvis-pyrius CBS 109.77]|uniref:Uncharacterized protein n=1 Tax=Melanomma pulvis-pyrius CBS 109.77 TaxID=1314802 RepID=A0A6A6XYC9_9PLEO|nr:hypothetical protein K505DRAFT_399929 [Melanomma pulvis-pyrius CBS 109.77]